MSSIGGTSIHSRELYRNHLTDLFHKEVVITSGDELKKYCPHLDREEIEQLIEKACQYKEVFFATPPLLVKHCYHVLGLFDCTQENDPLNLNSRKCRH